MARKGSAEDTIRDIKRKPQRKYGTEEKIHTVVGGLRGEESIAALDRREGIAESLYYKWRKEFMEAGKARLAGDTKRRASSGEVDALRAENEQLFRPFDPFCLKEFDHIHTMHFTVDIMEQTYVKAFLSTQVDRR